MVWAAAFSGVKDASGTVVVDMLTARLAAAARVATAMVMVGDDEN